MDTNQGNVDNDNDLAGGYGMSRDSDQKKEQSKNTEKRLEI